MKLTRSRGRRALTCDLMNHQCYNRPFQPHGWFGFECRAPSISSALLVPDWLKCLTFINQWKSAVNTKEATLTSNPIGAARTVSRPRRLTPPAVAGSWAGTWRHLPTQAPCWDRCLSSERREHSGRASFWGDAYTVRKWTRNRRTKFGNVYQKKEKK